MIVRNTQTWFRQGQDDTGDGQGAEDKRETATGDTGVVDSLTESQVFPAYKRQWDESDEEDEPVRFEEIDMKVGGTENHQERKESEDASDKK